MIFFYKFNGFFSNLFVFIFLVFYSVFMFDAYAKDFNSDRFDDYNEIRNSLLINCVNQRAQLINNEVYINNCMDFQSI